MENKTEQYWSMTEGVFNCLIDRKRSLAFKKALENTIKPGDIVLDMGTGSGILAMFAAKAGAKKVYAVEIDKNNIKTLNKTFVENNFADKIIIIEGDITKVKIPEKIDVVVGEMIATALIEELQVLAMNNVLKYTKKNYRVILNKYETFVDLVENNETYYGYEFKILRYEYPELLELRSKSYSQQQLIDVSDFSEIRKNLLVNKKLYFKIKNTGIINGIRLSGKTIFSDNSTLGPTFAYSYPLILPIARTSVRKDEMFLVDISYKICGGLKNLKYSIRKIKSYDK